MIYSFALQRELDVLNIRFKSIFWLIGLMSVAGLITAEETASGTLVIHKLNQALIDTMKNGAKSGFEGRYQKLAPIVEETHNLEYIARFSIGKKNWQNLDENQRQHFLEIFTIYSIATYADRFDEYNGEQFEILTEQPAKRGQIQVSAIFKLAEEDLDFNYILDKNNEHWQIVNIFVKGASDLALKRAKYKTLLSEQGFDALMEYIEEQTANIKNTK